MTDDYSDATTTEPSPADAMAAMQAELAQAQLESWRAAAVAKHPAVTPLQDMLVANSAEGVERLAADIAAKLGQQQTSTQAGPPVPAGMPQVYQQTDDERMEELRATVRRWPGSNQAWSDLLREKHARAGVPYPMDQK